MILFWFLSRQIMGVASMLRARLGLRACTRETTSLLRQLGRKAWDLRKQHVGMDDILAALQELEDESRKLARTAEELEQEVQSDSNPRREQVQELVRTQARQAKIQRLNAKNHLLLGKAVDASRHHDAALVEYYHRIDEVVERREAVRRHRKALRLSFLKTAPLALAELAALIILGVQGVRLMRPVLTGYHVVFCDDCRGPEPRWRLTHPKAGSVAAAGGVLTLRAANLIEARAFPVPERQFEDARVLMRVRAPAPDVTPGILFRYTDYDYYLVEFRRDRSCRLSICTAGKRSRIGDWCPCPGSVGRDGEFDIEATIERDQIDVSVDGHLVLRQKALLAWPGQVGLGVSSKSELQVVRFEIRARGLAGWLARCRGPDGV